MKRAVLSILLVTIASGVARAEDEDELPNPPRPQTLPQLTHRFTEINEETTFASLALAPTTSDPRTRMTVRVERLSFEIPLLSRRWFFGGAYSLALGDVVKGSPLLVSGNPEVFVRGTWASVTGIAFGGGFAIIAPTRGYDGSDALGVALAASSVRAWDRATFDPNALTQRAFIDMRDVAGPLVVQYRQALEVAADTRLTAGTTFAAVGTLYVGARVSRLISAGTQLVEYYSLEPDVSDATRAHWSFGGDVRITTRYFQPMIAVMTSLGSPLRALSSFGAPLLGSSPESFVGVRLGLSFVLDTSGVDRGR